MLLGTWAEMRECRNLSYHGSVDIEFCNWLTRNPCQGTLARRKPQHKCRNGSIGPLCIVMSVGVQNARSAGSSGLFELQCCHFLSLESYFPGLPWIR